MIEANPISLIRGMAPGLIAPEHATVVCSRCKLTMPSTFSLVTSCARAGLTEVTSAVNKPAAIVEYALTESSLLFVADHTMAPSGPPFSRYNRTQLTHAKA